MARLCAWSSRAKLIWNGRKSVAAVESSFWPAASDRNPDFSLVPTSTTNHLIMALTESTMLPLGTIAPDFSLTDTSGQIVSKSDFADCPLLVMFICNHCPYVKHVAPELSQLGKDYTDSPLAMVAIQSNDVEQYPDCLLYTSPSPRD